MTNEKQYWGVKEKLYSKIQYFFWLLSGSEISILKECPTEYNRHASIGFTIFMTCLFGTFSGGYAGYYFSKDPRVVGFDSGAIIPAIIFGIIWGMLIFSIDRSMVISLKKDPIKSKQKFWAPLISRAILGGLIAFIISIPLEIKIFEESIIENEKAYKENKIAELKDKKTKTNNIQEISKELNTNIKDKAIADSFLSLPEPNSIDYNQKKEEYNESKNKEKSLNDAWQNAKTKMNDCYITIPKIPPKPNKDEPNNIQMIPDITSKEYKNYKSLQNTANVKKKDFDNQHKLTESLKSEKDIIQKKWIAEKNTDKIYADSLAKFHQNQKTEREKIVQDDVDSLNNILKFQKGFILRYEILSFTAYKPGNSSVLFFLWLIRILFFVIEILPTVVKLTTPLGQYDWAVYKKEKDFVEIYLPSKSKEFEEDIEKKRKNKRRDEDYKNKKEEELYKITVDKVADVQNKIALTILKEYEEKTMNNISKNIDNFLDNNN